MKDSVVVVGPPDRPGGLEMVPAADVQRTLSAILQSTPFRSSMQIQKLLRFLVSETLSGRTDMLKERMIGASVFERRLDYDTNDDPIVRLRVAEVRKRLALYYQAAREEPVVISIPSGSFRAVFEWAGKSQVPFLSEPSQGREPTQPPLEPQTEPKALKVTEPDLTPASPRFQDRRWWIAIAASVVILTLAVLHYSPTPEQRAFNQFWSPVLNNSDTILIGMGNNPLYEPSLSFEDEYFKDHPASQYKDMGLHPSVPIPPGTMIDGKYLRPAENTYLTIGDLMALSDVEYMLARRNRKLDIRFVNDLTFGDLRQSPAILIGAHNNIWTLSATESLRFGFRGHSTIVDHFDPQKTWTANSDRSETYAIAARVMNSWNGKVVIVVGGVGYSATRAAADFITDPQAISKLARSLPKGWESKSIEVVLHTSVKNQIPAAADVVASYCW